MSLNKAVSLNVKGSLSRTIMDRIKLTGVHRQTLINVALDEHVFKDLVTIIL